MGYRIAFSPKNITNFFLRKFFFIFHFSFFFIVLKLEMISAWNWYWKIYWIEKSRSEMTVQCMQLGTTESPLASTPQGFDFAGPVLNLLRCRNPESINAKKSFITSRPLVPLKKQLSVDPFVVGEKYTDLLLPSRVCAHFFSIAFLAFLHLEIYSIHTYSIYLHMEQIPNEYVCSLVLSVGNPFRTQLETGRRTWLWRRGTAVWWLPAEHQRPGVITAAADQWRLDHSTERSWKSTCHAKKCQPGTLRFGSRKNAGVEQGLMVCYCFSGRLLDGLNFFTLLTWSFLAFDGMIFHRVQ